MCGWICVFCSSVCSSATDWSLEPSSHSDLTPLCARPTLLPLFPGLTENQGIVLSDIFFRKWSFPSLVNWLPPNNFYFPTLFRSARRSLLPLFPGLVQIFLIRDRFYISSHSTSTILVLLSLVLSSTFKAFNVVICGIFFVRLTEDPEII